MINPAIQAEIERLYAAGKMRAIAEIFEKYNLKSVFVGDVSLSWNKTFLQKTPIVNGKFLTDTYTGLKMHLPINFDDIDKVERILRGLGKDYPFLYKYATHGIGGAQVGKVLTIYVPEGLEDASVLQRFCYELNNKMYQNNIRFYSPKELASAHKNPNLLNPGDEWMMKGAEGRIYYSYDGDVQSGKMREKLGYTSEQLQGYHGASEGERWKLKPKNDPFEKIDLNNYRYVPNVDRQSYGYQNQQQMAASTPERSGKITIGEGMGNRARDNIIELEQRAYQAGVLQKRTDGYARRYASTDVDGNKILSSYRLDFPDTPEVRRFLRVNLTPDGKGLVPVNDILEYRKQQEMAASVNDNAAGDEGIRLRNRKGNLVLNNPEGQPRLFVGEQNPIELPIKDILKENKWLLDQGGAVLIGRNPKSDGLNQKLTYNCIKLTGDESISRTHGVIWKDKDGTIKYTDLSSNGTVVKPPKGISPAKLKSLIKTGAIAAGSAVGGTIATAWLADQVLGDGNSSNEGAPAPIVPVGKLKPQAPVQGPQPKPVPKPKATVRGAAKAAKATAKKAIKAATTTAKAGAKAALPMTMLMAAIDPNGSREFFDDIIHLRGEKLSKEALEAAQMLRDHPGEVITTIGGAVANSVSDHYKGTEGVGDAALRTGAALGKGFLNIGDTVWGTTASLADVGSDGANWALEKLGSDKRIAKDTITYEAYKRDPLKFVGNLIVPTTVDSKTGLRSDDDLYSIVKRGDAKALEAYIKEGKEDVNRDFKGEHSGDYIPYDTALGMALANGNMDVAKVLYQQKGANLNGRNEATGDTTLMSLLKGIAPTPSDKEYKTGVPDTASYTPKAQNNIKLGQAMIDDMLHNKNIDIEAENKEGKNAFLVAAETGNHAAVTTLAEIGTDLNKQSANGSNALHLSCHNQKMTMTLLQMGVDANHVNKNGETPLMTALTSGDRNLTSVAMLMMHSNEKGLEQLKQSPRHLEALDKILKEKPEALQAIMMAKDHPMQAFIKERYPDMVEKLSQQTAAQQTQPQPEKGNQTLKNKAGQDITTAPQQTSVVQAGQKAR